MPAVDPIPLPARRHPMIHQVACGLARAQVAETARIVAAVSGGADSLALLIALHVIHRRRGLGPDALHVVHVHHHLRGDDADADAAFVSEYAARLGHPSVMLHLDPASFKGNVAAAARDARYAALSDAAGAASAEFVATAHHADDQLETVLMAIGRGSGLSGLAGMPRRRALPERDGAGRQLVRPMLACRRTDAESLCAAAGTVWREDPSNDDRSRTRTAIRHTVVPALEAILPGAADRIGAVTESARAAREIIAASAPTPTANGALRWDRATLAELPVPTIGQALRDAAITIDPKRIDALAHRTIRRAAEAVADETRQPRRFDWPGGVVVHVDAHEVRLSAHDESSPGVSHA